MKMKMKDKDIKIKKFKLIPNVVPNVLGCYVKRKQVKIIKVYDIS